MGTALVAAAELAGFQLKFFTEAGGAVRIHYAEGPPNGPPLVLLHGLARDWRSFSVLLPELSSRFHVFALDLRGHGKSTHLPGSYRITEFARDVGMFLRTLLPDGVALFGYSLGGSVGMYVAADETCRITALVAGDTMISPVNFARSMYAPIFRQLHSIVIRGGAQADVAREIGKISFHVPGFDQTVRIEELPGNETEALMEWARGALQTDASALAMTIDESAFESWDAKTILPRISCPTLLLQGNPEMGAMLSDADVTMALRLLPRAECVRFPLLGHALFMQQAKPVLQAVTDFWERRLR